jgi:hypothetical protein
MRQTLPMDAELIVSLISAGAALVSVLLTAFLSARTGARQSLLQAEIEQQHAARRRQEVRTDLMSQVRDPLLWAAFDLQSRVYNIIVGHFLPIYRKSGSAEQRAYAQRNTLFLFAQFLAWVEVVRRSVRFLDLGGPKDNRTFVDHLSKIGGVLNSDGFPDLSFIIFRGDQRAIGEIMIESSPSGEPSCIGYAAFCERIDNEESFSQWFVALMQDIDHLAANHLRHPRLVLLQHCLIDLIIFLDPESIRFPDWHREKA